MPPRFAPPALHLRCNALSRLHPQPLRCPADSDRSGPPSPTSHGVASLASVSPPREFDPWVGTTAALGARARAGYDAAEVLGRNCRFLQGQLTDRGTVQLMGDKIKGGQPVTVQILNYRKSGEPFLNQARRLDSPPPPARAPQFAHVSHLLLFSL